MMQFITTIVLPYLTTALISSIIVSLCVMKAPMGWEDAKGFHAGKEPTVGDYRCVRYWHKFFHHNSYKIQRLESTGEWNDIEDDSLVRQDVKVLPSINTRYY